MRTGQAFLAGAVALGLCLALVGSAAAKPFSLNSAVLTETIDTISGSAVDCPDYPAASDSYVWTATLSNIKADLKKDFNDQPAIVAFVSKSCSPLTATKVTNTLEMPPGLTTIKTDSTTGVVTITFSGSLPDFNTFNTAANISYFDYMTLEVQYSPTAGTGTLTVTGNANLCDSLTATAGPPQQPQCLLFDTVSGYDCSCDAAPIMSNLDITSLFQ